MVPAKKNDNGFIIIGQEFDNCYSTIRVDKDGVRLGHLYKEGAVPDGEGDITRITTEQIAGPIYNIVDEKLIGKPTKVNSKAYRDGWDNIFGKGVVGQA
jgi:hypothetical protein